MADRTACVCDGGYEGCSADMSHDFGEGMGCEQFQSPNSYWTGQCVARGACTICCATCAAECAAAGVSTGCTACEAGERRALSRSSSGQPSGRR